MNCDTVRVAHIHNPSYLEAEAGRLQFWGQHGLLREILWQKVKRCRVSLDFSPSAIKNEKEKKNIMWYASGLDINWNNPMMRDQVNLWLQLLILSLLLSYPHKFWGQTGNKLGIIIIIWKSCISRTPNTSRCMGRWSRPPCHPPLFQQYVFINSHLYGCIPHDLLISEEKIWGWFMDGLPWCVGVYWN